LTGTAREIERPRVIFQRVLKGIPVAREDSEDGLSEADVKHILNGAGLYSNWWLNAPNARISPPQIAEKLTEDALIKHLVDYDTVEEKTPFISTTAGTVERDVAETRNVYFPPLYTALRFATRDFSQDGYVLYAYLFLLGRKSIELAEFAEEVRDVNTYTNYYAWHPEGEIVAKVHIPATRIEKAERYSYAGLKDQLDRSEVPVPELTLESPGIYRDPWKYANVRGFPESP
jgi:hypothetical protein